MNCPFCDHALTDLGDGEYWCQQCNAMGGLDDFEDAMQKVVPEVTLGERLYQLRLEKGLTLQELARQIGRTHASLSFVERGLNGATLNTLLLLANAYGMTLQELIAPVDFSKGVGRR